jgi:hypothetical protein
MFECEKCNKIFTTNYTLQQHVKNNSCKIGQKVKCDNCTKKFTTKAAMRRHIKTSCKNKNNYITDDEKQKIFEQLMERQSKMELKMELQQSEMNLIKKENKELKKLIKSSNTINNGTINNGTINTGNINNGVINNFTLYAHGKEDLDKIDRDVLLLGIKNGFNSTTKLTELINFNPKYPEYHNVYISNVKGKYAMKYDGKEWTLVRKHELIDNIYEQKRDYIFINMDNYSGSLTKVQKESLERWMLLDEIDPNDSVIKRIKSDIELMLYNNRNIPIKTTEKMIGAVHIDDEYKKERLLEKQYVSEEVKKVTKIKKHDLCDDPISLHTKNKIIKRPSKKSKKSKSKSYKSLKTVKVVKNKITRPRTKAKK